MRNSKAYKILIIILVVISGIYKEHDKIIEYIPNTVQNNSIENNSIKDSVINIDLDYLNRLNKLNVGELNNTRITPIEINNSDISEVQENIIKNKTYEYYGNLDKLNRVTIAKAYLDKSLMPKENRGDIMNVKPTGWKNKKYKNISGGWLYNRSHLIGFQLSGENDNWKNLMTGTRQMNTDMIPIENKVANYIKSNPNNKVYYRVIPKFSGNNLVSDGIEILAASNLDKNIDILFKVYIPNIQDGIEIDYSDGSSRKI